MSLVDTALFSGFRIEDVVVPSHYVRSVGLNVEEVPKRTLILLPVP